MRGCQTRSPTSSRPARHLADTRETRGHRLMSENAERRAALQRERAAALADGSTAGRCPPAKSVRSTSAPAPGAFAFAIAPRVREVVARRARRGARRARARRRAGERRSGRRRRRASAVRAFVLRLSRDAAHAAPHAAAGAARGRACTRHAARRDDPRRRPARPADPLVGARAHALRAGARPVDHPRPRRTPTCAGSSTRTASSCCARRSIARAARSRGVPRPRRLRGRRARARAKPRADRLRGRRRLVPAPALAAARAERPIAPARAPDPCEGAVPARHGDLAAVVLDGLEEPLDDERRVDDEPARAARGGSRCGKPSVSTKPGVHGVHRDAARRELDGDRARERELRVLRRRVRAARDGAGDRDDVDDVRACGRGPGRNASVAQTEPR